MQVTPALTPLEVEGGSGAGPDFGSMISESADIHTVVTADGVYRHVSGGCHELFQLQPDDLLGKGQDDFAHPDDVALLQASRSTDPGDGVTTTAYRFRCRDGTYRWTEATSRAVEDADGSTFLVATIRDIGERRRSDAALQLQAFLDPLTGVANRAVFMDRLRQGLRRLERGSGLVAVLFLDLDRFKIINDSLGHRVGDGVLLKMAERLSRFVRPTDTVARLGGDEFVIMAEGIGTDREAAELADRITEAGREPFRVDGEELVCTVSIGISTTADAAHGAEDLLQEADLALYRAKDLGRDRVELFGEELRTLAVGRLGTERMVRRAIEEDRVRVAYQPLLDLTTDRVVGVEALVRLSDDENGLLLPRSFLEVAEETGLLATIDERVLEIALQDASRWMGLFRAGDTARVAINLTARHLADARLAEETLARLEHHGLAATTLQVETTERVLIEASNSSLGGLLALRDAGVWVGLDDFGIGYSSLSALRRLPIDVVKIDQSLVQRLGTDGRENAVIAALVALCHALDLTVVAGGVETTGQLEELRALGCDRAHGYFIGRPDSAAEMDQRVRSQSFQTGS